MDARLAARYLDRLGCEAEPPSAGALARLHRAHVAEVPYETTWIHRGEPWGLERLASARRVAGASRGGYCFHLNGAFGLLLAHLGYRVGLHVGGVHRDEPASADLGNHLVLLVGDLPTGDHPSGRWYVDAGLGDALLEPMPLRAGDHHQAPLSFRLGPVDDGIGRWRLSHDARGGFASMSFSEEPATMRAFRARHRQLSTAPDSPFVRTVTAQRRQHDRVVAVRNTDVTVHTTAESTRTAIEASDEWFDLLADEFALHVPATDRTTRARLWQAATRPRPRHDDGAGDPVDRTARARRQG
jgi:arylamine N-acetyltransferase